MTAIKYKNFTIRTYPEVLSTRERLARNEWRSIITGWRYVVRDRLGKRCFEADNFASEEQALGDALEQIDGIMNGL